MSFVPYSQKTGHQNLGESANPMPTLSQNVQPQEQPRPAVGDLAQCLGGLPKPIIQRTAQPSMTLT